MAGTSKLIYPSSLNRDNYLQGLFPSNNPIFDIYKAKKSTIALPVVITAQNVVINFQYSRYTEGTSLPISFELNGITYQQVNNINGRNQFLFSSDLNVVYNSIYNMFLLNQTLEEWNIEMVSISWDILNFKLTYKQKGNVITPYSNSNNIVYLGATSTVYVFQNGSPSNSLYITTNMAIGDDVSQDVDGYEIGVDLYKDSYFQSGSPTKSVKIATISKKGFGEVDFDLSSLVSASITPWKPTLSLFSTYINKYSEDFHTTPFQKYIDKRVDINNTFPTIVYNGTPPLQIYDGAYFKVIDATEPLFDKINWTNTGYIQYYNIQNNGYGYLYSNYIYDRILSNQPRFKQINKGYELISFYVNTLNLISVGQYVNDFLEFNLYNLDGTYTTRTLNNTNIFTGEGSDYISQSSFKMSQVLSLFTTNIWTKLTVQMVNPLSPDLIVRSEIQTYYNNSQTSTVECDNINSDSEVYTSLVFKNQKGGFDVFEMNEIQTVNSDRGIDSIDISYNYKSKNTDEFSKIYNMDYSKSYNVKSRILTNDEYVWLEDLVKSNQVYILESDNKLYPIIITNTTYSYELNVDRVISITFQYSRNENI